MTVSSTSNKLTGIQTCMAMGGGLEVSFHRVAVFGFSRKGFNRGLWPRAHEECCAWCSPKRLAVVKTLQLVSECLLSATGVFLSLLTFFHTWSTFQLN